MCGLRGDNNPSPCQHLFLQKHCKSFSAEHQCQFLFSRRAVLVPVEQEIYAGFLLIRAALPFPVEQTQRSYVSSCWSEQLWHFLLRRGAVRVPDEQKICVSYHWAKWRSFINPLGGSTHCFLGLLLTGARGGGGPEWVYTSKMMWLYTYLTT